MEQRAQVFLACPRYDQVEWYAAVGAFQASQDADVHLTPNYSSWLTYNFNDLWANALNHREEWGLTHFAMLHSDVGPEPWWLDKLMAEQRRLGVQVMTTVIPIKDERGLTSTGLIQRGTNQVKRFSLAQVHHELPPSFTVAHVKHEPNEALAVNTGLWVCAFTEPWVEQVCFRTYNDIARGPDGKFYAVGLTEDWSFSLLCDHYGVTVGATSIVKATHYGRYAYVNDYAWGTQVVDAGGF